MLVIPISSHLYRVFKDLASIRRMVFMAGLPGVGKSLLLQQLALIATEAGRKVHLLQWDVARQPFETDEYVLAHYPEVAGVTHGMVRKAVGLWAREAVERWHQAHSDEREMLIGEVPLIGNRLIELAQRRQDTVEPLLSSEATRFVIPVPSRELRRLIETKREERSANPQHEREQADAIPQVLRALWLELYRVAHTIGLTESVPEGQINYDPDIYRGVYEALLKHRHVEVLPLTDRLETESLSAYDLEIQQGELIPTTEDVRATLAEVEQLFPTAEILDREIDNWYLV